MVCHTTYKNGDDSGMVHMCKHGIVLHTLKKNIFSIPLGAMPGLLQLRGRPIGGLFESTPSLRGLGRGSWEQQASRAMQREGTPGIPKSPWVLTKSWATAHWKIPTVFFERLMEADK